MADRARPSLLQLAALASLAIVPVMIGVLLVVASMRDADVTRGVSGAERHVSVRHVAALKTFEQAVVRRAATVTPPPEATALLDAIPECRAEWDGSAGLLTRVRRMIVHGRDAPAPPAARIALELAQIDDALVRFSAGDNRRVSDPVRLDGQRWLTAVRAALQTPVQTPAYPGREFRVQCADIAGAVSALARGNGRMLPALAWRGTEVDRVVARWRPDQEVEISPRQVARSNPWAGIPGCIYLAGAAEPAAPRYYLGGVRALDRDLCPRHEMVGSDDATLRVTGIPGEPSPDAAPDDPRWKVPPSLATMLQPLETLHRPAGALYRAYSDDEDGRGAEGPRHGPNRVQLGRNAVDVGYSVDVTIDPELQALAQQTAACYTGRTDVCQALGMRRKEDGSGPIGHVMLEHAMVRMAAIAVVDVGTGRIEALAGALSPCTRQEYDGPGRSRRCDRRLPYPIRYNPDALLNPAVYHDAMPASTIKPIMAAAFLSDAEVGARWLAAEQAEMARGGKGVPSAASMRAQLMRSDSARFLDRMFCGDRGFGPCDRPWSVQAMAGAFGWNGGCASARDDCGKRDLLFGRGVDAVGDAGFAPLSLVVPYGRLMAEPEGGRVGAPFRLWPRIALDSARVRACAAGADGRRGSKDDWGKCRGAAVVDVVAEGWGQGHARASAVGSAGMMAMLAAAANGQAAVPKPHLVARVHGVGIGDAAALQAGLLRADAEPNPIARPAAEVILSGLSFGHRAGTSRLACEQVFEPRACQEIDWIAGKTGTPTFPNDDRTLDELARLCAKPAGARSRDERMACGPLRPYKWYVAAYRTGRDDPRWTKVIAVLTERNWIAATGRVHGAGDHGPNPAAEIAMQIAGRHVGALPWSAP